MPKGVAEQLAIEELAARPFDCDAFLIRSNLVLRVDQSSRLVNEFGRALLKRVVSPASRENSSKQLFLKL